MDFLKFAKEVFDTEIQGLIEVKNKISDNFVQAINLIDSSKGRVVITGMGKSGLVGQKIAATMSSTGTKALFVHPAEAYHGDLGMIDSSDVVIAISNSGESEEIVRIISFFKHNKNKIISMTGNFESTLAKHSDVVLDIGVSKEACPLELAPTTSTTVTMAFGDALAVALMKKSNFQAENFALYHPGGSLGRKLLTTVKDLMQTSELPIINKDSNFSDIITQISKGRCGIAVVIENNEAIGVVTDGDIRRVIKSENEKALSLKAQDFYTKNPLTISSDEKIVSAETLMQQKKVSVLIVVESKKFVGLLNRYDI